MNRADIFRQAHRNAKARHGQYAGRETYRQAFVIALKALYADLRVIKERARKAKEADERMAAEMKRMAAEQRERHVNANRTTWQSPYATRSLRRAA